MIEKDNVILEIRGGRVTVNVNMLTDALRERRPNKEDSVQASYVIEELLATCAQQPNFQRLRDEWALKAPSPTPQELHTAHQIEANHNLSREQITSQLAYSYADGVLSSQYSVQYTDWIAKAKNENTKQV